MVGETLIARGIVAVGEEAAGTALGQEAIGLMAKGARSVLPAAAVDFLDEAGAKVLNALGAGRTREVPLLQFDYLAQPTSKAAMGAMEGLPVAGMNPEAFKVLTSDGLSPNFGALQWSLPKLEQGKWIPGSWMDVSHHPFGMDGLFVSNNAERWLSYYGKPGHPPVTAFRVQIGDPVSRQLWQTPIKGMDLTNFRAKTVRLLEPLVS